MYKQPQFSSIRFSCPHCGALAHQYWSTINLEKLKKDETPMRYEREALETVYENQKALPKEDRYSDYEFIPEYIRSAAGSVFCSKHRKDPYSYKIYNLEAATCDSCGEMSIWMKDKMVYPANGPAGIASKDMPERVKELFDEAGAVFATSPRASAALLRLSLQHLLIELGGMGKDINTDINTLINNGLDPDIAKIMHSLRIIGNESVHPGVISVDDEPYIAEALFELLNQIVEQLITRPRKHKEIWDKLPEAKRNPVEVKLAKQKK